MKQLDKVQVDSNLLEKQQHGTFAFPLQVYLDDMDSYERNQVPWHWHPELEFAVMLKGSVRVLAPGFEADLQPGDGYFANTNVLHAVEPLTPGAVFFSVLFSPRMLAGHAGSLVGQEYLAPLLACEGLRALPLKGSVPWQAALQQSLRQVYQLFEEKPPGYELAITARLYEAWGRLYTGCRHLLQGQTGEGPTKDEVRIKQMMDFIYGNFADEITLEDIARAANLSTSECCRCFKRTVQSSPFAFLNQHRLHVAAQLLQAGATATGACTGAGFQSLSYFGKQFKAAYGCTPLQYKKQAV